MENKILKAFGYWAIGLILIVATVIVIRWAVDFVSWLDLSAGWAQAIGAVASIWGAFWLADRTSREQAARERTLAVVAAAVMVMKAEMLEMDVSRVAKSLGEAVDTDFSVSDCEAAINFLKSLPTWSTDEIALLMPLDNQCAQKLAGAQGRIQFVISLLERGIRRQTPVSPRERRIRVAGLAKTRLEQAVKRLDSAVEVMKHSQRITNGSSGV